MERRNDMKRIGTLDEYQAGAGNLPPQSIDLEQILLGTAMLDKVAVPILMEQMSAEMFYTENHQKIFAAIQRLFSKGLDVDIMTVSEELRLTAELNMVGGPFYVSQLTNRVAGSGHIDTHIHIVIQAWIKRECIRVGNLMVRDGFDETVDVFDLTRVALSEMNGLVERGTKETFGTENDVMAAFEGPVGAGPSPAFGPLLKFGSFPSGKPTVVGARSGIGKTSFGLAWAWRTAEKTPGLFLSMEMGHSELMMKLASMNLSIDYQKAFEKRLDPKEMMQIQQWALDMKPQIDNIMIDESEELTPISIEAKIQKAVATKGIGWVVLDYIQLVGADPGKKLFGQTEITQQASRRIRAIAKKYDVAFLVLSQLTPNTANPSAKPRNSDLRYSKQIEMDAHKIILMHRPNYYTDEVPDHDWVEFIMSKNRSGKVGMTKMRFYGPHGQYDDQITRVDIPAVGQSDQDFSALDGETISSDGPF